MSIDNVTKISKGVISIDRQHHNLDFIVSETHTPNGKTRVQCDQNAGQFPGALVDKDGKPVALKAVADAKSIAGVCLTAPSSVFGNVSIAGAGAAYIRGVPGVHVELKDVILSYNGFRNVSFTGGKYVCTGLDGLTGTGAATTAQSILEAVCDQLKAIRVDLLVTGA